MEETFLNVESVLWLANSGLIAFIAAPTAGGAAGQCLRFYMQVGRVQAMRKNSATVANATFIIWSDRKSILASKWSRLFGVKWDTGLLRFSPPQMFRLLHIRYPRQQVARLCNARMLDLQASLARFYQLLISA
jgi:hypothetical protein